MVPIDERPAEVDERAVPGHREGDLVRGKRPSAVGTLAERTSRDVVLFALPDGRKAERFRGTLAAAVARLPEELEVDGADVEEVLAWAQASAGDERTSALYALGRGVGGEPGRPRPVGGRGPHGPRLGVPVLRCSAAPPAGVIAAASGAPTPWDRRRYGAGSSAR